MISPIKRIIEAIVAFARNAVPLNGIFGIGWQPGCAIAIYWIEFALLAAVAVALCWRMKHQLSDEAIVQARAAGALDEAKWIADQQQAARTAGLDLVNMALIFGVSLTVFGVFTAMSLGITSDGIDRPFDWNELSDGATAIAVVIAVGLAIDLFMFPTISVAMVQDRVNACMTHWALLWTMGFVGTALLVFTGSGVAYIWLFAVLKTVLETSRTLKRGSGWKGIFQPTQE